MTTHSSTESTNGTQPKRITKTDLNQLAKTGYGDEAYCEHIRTGQRGWYLYIGSEPVFLGVNAADAFHSLQSGKISVNVVTDSTTTEEEVPITDTKETTEPQDSENMFVSRASEIDRPDLSAEDMLKILIEKFPNTFFKEPEKIRPIQKYVHKKIRRALDYKYTKEEVSAALALYTQSIDYCNSLISGGQRVDLEGKPCGEISPEHIADARARIAGEIPMRPAKKKKSKPVPISSSGPPPIDTLITGKMELSVKINELPLDSKTVKNGWQEFVLDINGQIVKITVRPKTWNKMQKAATEYPFWIAHIKGKMGTRIKGGFELEQPAVQIFERNPKDSSIKEEPVNNENT